MTDAHFGPSFYIIKMLSENHGLPENSIKGGEKVNLMEKMYMDFKHINNKSKDIHKQVPAEVKHGCEAAMAIYSYAKQTLLILILGVH